MAYIVPFCCSKPDKTFGNGNGGAVPRDAKHACRQLRAATRAALASGYRNMLVDVLAEPMRRSSRTYDFEVHCCVVESICRALKPALSHESPNVMVATSGPKTALNVRQYFQKSSELIVAEQSDEHLPPPVRIEILGAGRVNDSVGAVVVVDPVGNGSGMLELRKLVRSAMAIERPVIVLNHPQPGSLHKIANCSGALPLELSQFSSVYTMAPFALRLTTGTGSASHASRGFGRFVFTHAFPGKWQLWRVQDTRSSCDGTAAVETPDTVAELLSMSSAEENETLYALMAEWTAKPTEQALIAVVNRAGREESQS